MVEKAEISGPAARSLLVKSRLARPVFFACGWLCVVIGVAGLILPILPGTVFLILAAWCFSRSSERFETWLLGHPRLGPSVVAWRARGVIPRKAKLWAGGSMAAGAVLAWLGGAPGWALAVAYVCMGGAAAYVFTRPEG